MRSVTVHEAAFAPPGALSGMSVQALQAPPAAFCRYWCFVTPESSGPAQASVTRASPPIAVKPVGFAGGAVGVAVASSDAGPAPTAFTARSLKA